MIDWQQARFKTMLYRLRELVLEVRLKTSALLRMDEEERLAIRLGMDTLITEISPFLAEPEARLVQYVAETLPVLVDGFEPEKTYDFADAAHNIPAYLLGMDYPCFWDAYIQPYRIRYGEAYFSGYQEVFTRGATRETLRRRK